MLASSFKSAEDLKVPPEVHAALCEVLRGLESGEYVHASEEGLSGKRVLDMCVWGPASCGSVACMGGWTDMELEKSKGLDRTYPFMRDVRTDQRNGHRQLRDLFYPWGIKYWSDITVERAARTLRRYLETGKVRWGRDALRTG